MSKKILIILHNIAKAQEHEWFVDLINRDAFELEFVLINKKDGYMNSFLAEKNIKTWYFDHNSKKDLPKITYGLYKLMRRNNYDIVHAHLFEAALVGMTAAWLAGVPKRIITRHHSDFHHVWHPQAVKYDKYTNRLATDIVAISKNVEEILIDREGTDPKKVRLIHHGIDLKAYEPENIAADRIQRVKETYHIPSGVPVVGVISRFIELKGLQYLIPAFIRFRKDYPNAVLVLANAKGTYTAEVMELLKKMDERDYRLITFENDVPALYLTFSMFAHVPISKYAEAFGQIYIESLACRIPSIFTLSGVAPEFAKDRVNCLVVPFCDEDAIYDAFCYVQRNPEVMKQIIQNGFDLVHSEFDVMKKIKKLEKLYSE